jgi:hypothetical protein
VLRRPAGCGQEGSVLTGLVSPATKVVAAIPDTLEDMPDEMRYDGATSTLHVGAGAVSRVPRAVWEYQVSGMRVVRKWFGYRKKTPAAKWSSPLSDISSQQWRPQDTTALLDLLNVLGLVTELEPVQADLLERIRGGALVDVPDMVAAGVLGPDALPSGTRLTSSVLF